MPDPGSHKYDIKRTRLRDEYDDRTVPRAIASEVELRSQAFTDNTLLPDRFSYAGGNTSPPLEWYGIPDGTAELALLCEDPDAPGGTFAHWVVVNISPESTGVSEGAVPSGAVEGGQRIRRSRVGAARIRGAPTSAGSDAERPGSRR